MENGPEQEAQLQPTPQELNTELNKFFELIPVNQPRERSALPQQPTIKERATYDIEKDGNPEEGYEEALYKRLSELLDHAHITPQFKNEICITLTTGIKIGISKLLYDEELQDLYYFINLDPRSGGVFDSQKAPDLERKAIARETVGLQQSEERLKQERESELFPDENDDQLLKREEWLKRRRKNLGEWIDNFPKVHKQDLVS